ncbi:hypothetical protein HNR23_002957 [Nocardiopsis mwathae]|uniref:Uncharacterized protein n=1 Tax=Nocardiopsis mwathae TaxID=1472723 RepID=A0A7W9YIU7_9ACTN|nr:hypothetical protein [Nocardiopsis mwathae]MBB6172897.1 hypothetical protein [Nocardiopsis mwathae]
MDASPELSSGGELAALRHDFPRWRIYRSRNPDGSPAAWVASNITPGHRVAPILCAGTPAGLRAQANARQVPQRTWGWVGPPVDSDHSSGRWGCLRMGELISLPLSLEEGR